LEFQGSGITVTNTGTITGGGPNIEAIYSSGANTTIINIGTVRSDNRYDSILIGSSGINNAIVNRGAIINTENDRGAIHSMAGNTTITNSGTISSNETAIWLSGSNATVNLERGSVIVGDIVSSALSTGQKLNISVGSGASYAYSVTGPWTIKDLDNRPMVTGSAYAAGIGAHETASEMLYQRTSGINSSLDNRLRSYASTETGDKSNWVEVYYSDVSRNSGGHYSTRTAFSNHNYGLTAGFKLSAEVTPLEMFVNLHQSNLNIDSGSQKINGTSIVAGLLAPSMAEVLGGKLSAKTYVGFADHSGDRQVLTNNLLYDGSRQIKSNYNSSYAGLGTALSKLYFINDHLTADALAGVDLVSQHTNAFAENAYFAWQRRTLSQLQSRVQVRLDHRFNQNNSSVFARIGFERRDLISGRTQHYAINGTNVSFDSNNRKDTYMTVQLGVKAQLAKRTQMLAFVNRLKSSDTVSSTQISFALRADY
jgi:hypothetical protein